MPSKFKGNKKVAYAWGLVDKNRKKIKITSDIYISNRLQVNILANITRSRVTDNRIGQEPERIVFFELDDLKLGKRITEENYVDYDKAYRCCNRKEGMDEKEDKKVDDINAKYADRDFMLIHQKKHIIQKLRWKNKLKK